MTTQRNDAQPTEHPRDEYPPTEYSRTDYQATDQPRFEQAADPSAAPTQPLPHDEFDAPAQQPVADQTMGAPLGVDEPSAAWSDAPTRDASAPAAPAPTAPPAPAHDPTPAGEATDSLFAVDDLSGLRSRWDDVQAEFVDDPRMCVQKADGLVSDVVDQLTEGFAHARSHLEEQWARGEEVSTEDLRLALTRYREFFQRLLAV